MKELIYPHFLKCIEFTDDIFWKNVFEELAFGNPPYNTYIRKHYLISNVKNKEFNYKITSEIQPKEIFDDLYNILHNKLGLISDVQIREDEINFENLNKTKTLKHSIIEEYCNRIGKEHKLCIYDIKKLLNHINLSLTIRNITSNDISYDDNGYIIDINGIEIKDDEIILDTLMSNCNHTCNDTITDFEYMYSHWNKYITLLIK